MSYLSAVVGVKDAAGKRIDVKRKDGTRAPIMLKLDGGITGDSAESGGFTEVTLTGTQKLLVDGVAVTPASAEWNLIGASAEYNAATGQVDIHVGGGGLDWQESVRVATAAALPANTRTGNVLTADANGSINATGIDGVTNLAVGERVLVKDEATGANNGLYRITALGDGSTPWSLERVPTADMTGEVTSGMTTYVSEGSQAGTFWTLTTADPIELNVTALTFTQNLSGSGVSGTGVAGRLTRWSTPTAIEESGVTEDGSGNLGATSLSLGPGAADAGDLRLGTTAVVRFLKQADDGNVDGLAKTSGDVIQLGGVNALGVQLRVGANPVFEGVATKLQAHQPIELQPSGGTLPSIGHLRARGNTTILAARGTGADHAILATDAADGLIVGAASLAGVTVANDVLRVGIGLSAIQLSNAGGTHLDMVARTAVGNIFGNAQAATRIVASNTTQVLSGGSVRFSVDSSQVIAQAPLRLNGTTAGTGALRGANGSANGFYFRDAANSADILGIAVDASDNLLLGDSNVTLTNVASPLAVGSASGTVATSGDIRGRSGFVIRGRDSGDTANRNLLNWRGDNLLEVGSSSAPTRLSGSSSVQTYAGGSLALSITSAVTLSLNTFQWSDGSTPSIGQPSTSSTTAANMSMTAQASTHASGVGGTLALGGGTGNDKNGVVDITTQMHVGNGGFADAVNNGNQTLTRSSAHFQKIGRSGLGTSTLTLPAEADSDGMWFWVTVYQSGESSGPVSVQDDATNEIAELSPSESALFVCDGTSWTTMGVQSVSSAA